MPRHAECRILPYSAEQLFDLVHEVERYPEFLPWCLDATITDREEGAFHADLLIGFRALRETFGSRVEYRRPSRIDVVPTHGPFRRMENHWRFEDVGEGRCRVGFSIDFRFRSRFLQFLMEPLFFAAVQRMVREFEARAKRLYGGAGSGSGRREMRPRASRRGPAGDGGGG